MVAGLGPRRGQRLLGRLRHQASGLFTHFGHLGRGKQAPLEQGPLQDGNRVVPDLVVQLGLGPVLALGIGRRMRIWPRNGGVDQGGAEALADARHDGGGIFADFEIIPAVDAVDGQPGEALTSSEIGPGDCWDAGTEIA